ncbi:MAG TPA: sulfotransferase [Bryobacteraceae bacterium]|nr:sulfotransferase [Bryobacteraceae bacterium]
MCAALDWYHVTALGRLNVDPHKAVTKPPVFIVGAPRSGTTLLLNMLNRHASLAIARETQFQRMVYARRKAFGDLTDPRNRQRLVREYLSTKRFQRLGIETSKLADRLLQDATDYRAFFTLLLEHYAQSQGKSRFGEKTPYHADFAETLCEWYPGAVILHLVRDPRDVVASLQRMPWASHSVLNNARVWLNLNRSAQRSRHRPGYLEVRYEALVTKPERELARICVHLGEEWSDSMLVPREEATSYSWWTRRSVQPVTSDLIGTWKHQLRGDEVALIEWMAGDEMDRLGYQLSAVPPSLLHLAQGSMAAAFDSIRVRLGYLPASLHRIMGPTQLAKEEFRVLGHMWKTDRPKDRTDSTPSDSTP